MAARPERLSMPAPAAPAAESAVSVVIPCFNQAHYLAEAIQSVAAQTEAAAEVIVVDDGSTDTTAEVAASYPWVRYLRQENRGLAAARNTGLRAATGEYVVFLDADDRLLPDALREGKRCLRASPGCAFAFGQHRHIAGDGAVLPEAPRRWRRPADPYQAFLEGNYIGMHATVMYRRAPLLAAGGFDPALPACEDYELYLRLTRRHAAAEHPALVAEYRQHESNMSRDAGMMLRTTLGVLGAQQPLVRGNHAYRRSYRRGIRRWRDYYGERLLDELRRLLAGRRWEEAGGVLGTLLRLCGPRLPMVLALYSLPDRLRAKLRERRAG